MTRALPGRNDVPCGSLARLLGPVVIARGGYPGSAQKVVLLLRSDLGVGEHLEGMTGRNQSDRVVVLPERSALGCGCLLDGQLGQRVGLQPLVGIGWPLRTDRP